LSAMAAIKRAGLASSQLEESLPGK